MRNHIIALLAGWILAALLPGGAAAAATLPARSSMASGVTITVKPLSLGAQPWEFEVVLESHSAELNDDLTKTASLLVDGETAASPLAWRGDPPGGHHRKGVLRFKPLAPSPARFELRIQRPGEPSPRVFRWVLREER